MRGTPSPLGWLVPILVAPASAAAQDATLPAIPVGPVGEDEGTEIEFHSPEPGLLISVAPAGSEDAGLERFPGERPASAKPLCETPCRLRVSNGDHTFLAGTNRFHLTATGGTEIWDVEDESSAKFWSGVMLVSAGVAGILVGGMVLGFAFLDDPDSVPMIQGGSAGLALGVVATVAGGLLWSWSYGSATRRPPDEAPAVGLGPGTLVLRF